MPRNYRNLEQGVEGKWSIHRATVLLALICIWNRELFISGEHFIVPHHLRGTRVHILTIPYGTYFSLPRPPSSQVERHSCYMLFSQEEKIMTDNLRSAYTPHLSCIS